LALIGVRGGLATAAVCVLGAIVLTAGTAFHWLTPRPGAGSPLGGFVFVVLPVLALVLFWAYPLAWMTTADLTPEERGYYINKELDKNGVSARLPSRGIVKVSRDDIAEIGASRCAQDYRCADRGGRSRVCFDVDVTYYCAYDIRDRRGNAGTSPPRRLPRRPLAKRLRWSLRSR
jgi:hypothetical protein